MTKPAIQDRFRTLRTGELVIIEEGDTFLVEYDSIDLAFTIMVEYDEVMAHLMVYKLNYQYISDDDVIKVNPVLYLKEFREEVIQDYIRGLGKFDIIKYEL